MSSVIAPASLLRTIASLQAELSSLQAALGVEGVVIASKGKAKKVKDPNAEPKVRSNVWIQFTQRVGALFKENNLAVGAPATRSKQFCSFLKDQPGADGEPKGYIWEDADILTAFASWQPPETSKMEAAGKTKKAKADSASETGSVSDSSAKPRAKRAPMTEEAKALRKEKMAAKKAAAASEPAEAAPAAEAAPKPAPKPAAFKPKAVAKPVYTMEQLTDLDGFEHEGVSYGRNIRGDVVSEDGSYVGHWNGKALKKGAAPADWEAVKAAM
jgi:hypothetical protein